MLEEAEPQKQNRRERWRLTRPKFKNEEETVAHQQRTVHWLQDWAETLPKV